MTLYYPECWLCSPNCWLLLTSTDQGSYNPTYISILNLHKPNSIFYCIPLGHTHLDDPGVQARMTSSHDPLLLNTSTYLLTMLGLNRFPVGQAWNCQAFAKSSSRFFRTNKLGSIRHEGYSFPSGGGSKKSLSLKTTIVNSGQANLTHLLRVVKSICPMVILFKPNIVMNTHHKSLFNNFLLTYPHH